MMPERGIGFQYESMSVAAAILSTLTYCGFEDSLYYYGDLQGYKKVLLSSLNALESHNIHGVECIQFN